MTMAMNGGYSVPIGVHKISCRSPGLAVTIDVHRRSPPVRRSAGQATNGQLPDSYTKNNDPIILAPNRFVEVAEVQQHGGRIRGRIIWEEVYDPQKDKSANGISVHSSKDLSSSLPHVSLQGKEPTKSSSSRFDKVHSIEKSPDEHHSKFRIGRPIKVVEKILPGKKTRGKSPNSTVSSNSNENNSGSGNNNISKRKTDKIFIQYQGWISLQWTDDHKQQEHNSGNGTSNDAMTHKKSNGRSIPYADEDEGPWTEPVTLGVYRINFNGGLPLRKTSDRDSQVLDVLERGRHFEVLETSVKEDRVRARCLVPPPPISPGNSGNGEEKEGHRSVGYQNGYISLANAVSGSTGVSPVPLGAYVAVADCGCPVTEGARLDTKMREVLVRGTCFEVTATRMEEGVVRGLVAWGGFVSLFAPGSGVPSKSSNSNTNGAKQNFTKHGNIRADGGINFAMPVPLGQYSIIYPHGLPVTAGFSRHTPIKTKLKLDDIVEVVETRVEDGKVRGRLSAIICAAGISRGWISIFDPSCRWAKFVGRDSGGSGNGGSGKGASGHRHSQRGTSGRKLDF